MNRVIKFRGQCAISKEMVYGDLIHGVGHKKGQMYILPDATNLAYVKHCDPLDGVNVNPETVGQFTGLDKNGKEIFEGDFSRHGYIVKYCPEKALFALYSKDGRLASYPISADDFPSIGNIHENPELLNPSINTN